MPTVSVVVPAYNAERWLKDAVASVVAQSETDWELILVDDGSSDRTPALCDRFARADRRIRVIHTPNCGVSEARNHGIASACGEWLMFLDADDIIHPAMIRTLLENAERAGAEISSCDTTFFTVLDHPFEEMVLPDAVPVEMTPVDAVEAALFQCQGINVSPWAKIYARSLWNNISFRPTIRYEDLDIFYRVWLGCRRIVHVAAPLYGYRQHQESFMHRFTQQRADVLEVTERMEQWIANNAADLLPAARDRRMSANFNIFLLAERACVRGEISRAVADTLQNRCFSQIRRLRAASLSNPRVRMRNRLGALISYLGPGVLRLLHPLC